MISSDIQIQEVAWQHAEKALSEIRIQVFIKEQGVPETLEWDGLDAECIHLLAVSSSNIPVGTVRLLPDGHIGRMAVLKEWRNRGVGKALLLRILDIAQIHGIKVVVLNAQTSAQGFYEKLGFHAVGEEFMDAGIPHYKMTRDL